MSLRSSSVKSLDPEVMLDDGDLDYEPDWLENSRKEDDDDDDNDIQVPEPSGIEFQETLSNLTSSESRSVGYGIKEAALANIINFRSHMNYMDMHIDEEKNSCRSNFASYIKDGESYHLDSSDEDVEPEFSDGISDYAFSERNCEVENEVEYTENSEPLPDPNYIEPKSPMAPEYQYCLKDYDSDSSVYENRVNFANLMTSPSSQFSDKTIQQFNQSPTSALRDSPGLSTPKKKSLNFTVKVVGQSRFRLPVKERQKPWLPCMQKYLPETIISLNSMDEVIQFCPETEVMASPSSLHSSESQKSYSLHSSDMSMGVFKVPLKRPPTRQKSFSKNLSISIDQKVGTISVKEPEDNCDIISLTASTYLEDNQEEVQEPFILEMKSEQPSSPERTTNLEETKMTRIAQWIQNADMPQVPRIYKGLCYNYFFYDNCTKRMCNNSHLLISPLTKIARLESLPDNELINAYNFAKSIPFFYSAIYPVFAEIFGKKDFKMELINMVNSIFETEKINKIEGIQIILDNLQRTDLGTFSCSVDYLLLEVGLRSFPNLGEILLEIIIGMNDLPKHWPLLRKLFIAGEKLPLKLASKFLIKLMKDPVDYKVCLDVHLHISKYKCLDMPLIPFYIKEPFLKLISMGETPETIDAPSCPTVNSANRDLVNPPLDFLLTTDFSVPPPNFVPVNRTEKAFNQLANPLISSLHSSYPRTSRSNSRSSDDSTIRSTGISDSFSVESRLPTVEQIDPVSRSSVISPRNFLNNNQSDYASVIRQPPFWNVQRPDIFSNSEVNVPPKTSREMDPSCHNFNFNPAPPPTRTYNREGLQYDPTNDYVPPPKRPQVDSGSHQKRLKTTYQEVVDPLVSSSSDPEARKEKPPDYPMYGKPYFDPNYIFNVSLHNLYLQQIDNVDINEFDVHCLNEYIKKGNGRLFLDLIKKYSGPATIQNFISMTLAHLKGFMGSEVARVYQVLLASIEKCNRYFYGDVKIRVPLEVITMNLLFELERRTLFKEATDLLMKFSNWDSLITSRLFITNMRTGVSIVGRYLFIAKLLIYTKPELTYEILSCRSLHLLENYNNWPYIPPLPTEEVLMSDLAARNIVLTSFLENGFFLNAPATTELYKIALKSKEGIWKFDVRRFINPMFVQLLNQEQIISLKSIFKEINLFINFMEKDSIRGFLIVINRYLSNIEKFRLLEICFARNIYKQFVGSHGLQHTIEIKTDMDQCEIELFIIYYFHKLLELRNIPAGSESLKFEIKLPGESRMKHIGILNKNKSLLEVKTIIKQILKTKYSIECSMYQSNIVEVEKNELIKYIENVGTTTQM